MKKRMSKKESEKVLKEIKQGITNRRDNMNFMRGFRCCFYAFRDVFSKPENYNDTDLINFLVEKYQIIKKERE